MKVAGIIAEYNPFHKGHKYQLEKIKTELGVDYCVIIMSGDFVQRGEPAIIGKYERATMALISGADLVIELPSYFSTASAEYFAEASLAILDKLGVVDYLCFGSECGDINTLSAIAEILSNEPDEYKQVLQAHLKNGLSFPKARENALISYFSMNKTESEISLSDIISSPNNLLGIEYLKAIHKRESKIIPVTLKRAGSNYNETSPANSEYPSALSIRNLVKNLYSEKDSITQNPGHSLIQIPGLPNESSSIFYESISNFRGPVFVDHVSHLLQVKLLQSNTEALNKYADISKELADRIMNNIMHFETFSDFCLKLKTKELTYSRISRALLHVLLDCTKNELDYYKSNDYADYGHILGFRSESSSLLKEIKSNGTITLLTKAADARETLSVSDLMLFNHTVTCSHIYESILHERYQAQGKNMYQQSPVII